MTLKDKVKRAAVKVERARKEGDPSKLRMALQNLEAWKNTTEEEVYDHYE